MERVKIAIVGCGGMGRRHLRGLGYLYRSDFNNLELVAVCDLNEANARDLADEASEVLGSRPRVFADLAAMTAAVDGLRAVDITTDAGSHHRVATAVLGAGLHVMCEKPLAVTLRGCNLVVEAARQCGLILSVAENYRRDPINRLARALIDDGAIGSPRVMFDVNLAGRDAIAITPWRHMRHTGAISLDAGVHQADILRYYLGEVRTVYGESRLHEKVRRNVVRDRPGDFYAKWSKDFPPLVHPTGEDALYAFVSFESGAIGQWSFDYAGHGKPKHEREVYGSRGTLISPGDRNGRPIRLHLDDGVVDGEAVLDYAPSYRLSPLAAQLFGSERPWTFDFDFGRIDQQIMALEYHELGECVLTGREPEVTGEEGRLDVALTYAPFEAGRIGRAITLEEMIRGEVDVYLREIDREIGLL